jgi:small multidrug resistance family-3 protein
VLFLYGIIPTFQPSHFSRVYAAYGGVFVVLSLAWGWLLDRQIPDRFDVAGALLCLVGVALIMYAPRGLTAIRTGRPSGSPRPGTPSRPARR